MKKKKLPIISQRKWIHLQEQFPKTERCYQKISKVPKIKF